MKGLDSGLAHTDVDIQEAAIETTAVEGDDHDGRACQSDPNCLGEGVASDVMKPIAAPIVGGMNHPCAEDGRRLPYGRRSPPLLQDSTPPFTCSPEDIQELHPSLKAYKKPLRSSGLSPQVPGGHHPESG